MIRRFVVPLFISLVTCLHYIITDTSATGIANWAFMVFPLLGFTQSLSLAVFRNNKLLSLFQSGTIAWSLVALLYHTVFLHWALTEILFLGSILFTKVLLMRKAVLDKSLVAILVSLIGLVIIHTVLNTNFGEFSYAHPSGSIMTVGILGLLTLSFTSTRAYEQRANKRVNDAEQLSKSLTNLLLSVGHALRTPLTTLKLKTEILALKNSELQISEELNKEIDSIILLFNRFEKALKTDWADLTLKALADSMERPVPYEIIQIKTPLRATKLQMRYLSTILNLLVDNALEHGRGKEFVKFYQSEGLVSFTVENEGKFFNPKEFISETGLFKPEVSFNNRLGVSLTTVFSLAEAIGYNVDFEARKDNCPGTCIRIAPNLEYHPNSQTSDHFTLELQGLSDEIF